MLTWTIIIAAYLVVGFIIAFLHDTLSEDARKSRSRNCNFAGFTFLWPALIGLCVIVLPFFFVEEILIGKGLKKVYKYSETLADRRKGIKG